MACGDGAQPAATDGGSRYDDCRCLRLRYSMPTTAAGSTGETRRAPQFTSDRSFCTQTFQCLESRIHNSLLTVKPAGVSDSQSSHWERMTRKPEVMPPGWQIALDEGPYI